jgi:hypothetical protein
MRCLYLFYVWRNLKFYYLSLAYLQKAPMNCYFYLYIATQLLVLSSLLCSGEFCTIFNDFCIHGVNKAAPGTIQMNAFWCVFAGQATAWVFDHCNTGRDTFSCSFCGDFRCILTSFCKILDARLEPWSRCMNGHWSTSKCVFFIIFWSVFDPAKIELQPLLCGFPEK